MSRRGKSSSNQTGPPPSHPLELSKDHRAFLIRSLERNDVELAAMVDLNRSLRILQKQIIHQCGEATLLDLGEGKVKLNVQENDLIVVAAADKQQEVVEESTTSTTADQQDKDEDSPPSAPLSRQDNNTSLGLDLSPIQKSLCIEFLLRMKLRRKLLNRYCRRLNRIAHAMDGEDVSPPGHPRGYTRLQLMAHHIEASANRRQIKEDARQRIQAFRNKNKSLAAAARMQLLLEQQKMAKPMQTLSSVKDEPKDSVVPAPSSKDDTMDVPISSSSNAADTKDNDNDEATSKEDVKAMDETTPSATNEEDSSNNAAATTTSSAASEVEAPKSETLPTAEKTKDSQNQQSEQPEGATSSTTTSCHPDPIESDTSSVPLVVGKIVVPSIQTESGIQQDLALIREYNTVYEQTLDLTTHEVNYAILDDEPTNGADGSDPERRKSDLVRRSMSEREQDAEFKRWQTSLLARIPEMPTFEDLGLKNRVFFLRERRKRLQEEAEAATEEDELPSKKVKTDDDENKKEDGKTDDDENKEEDDTEDAKENNKEGDDKDVAMVNENKEGEKDSTEDENDNSKDDSDEEMADDKEEEDKKVGTKDEKESNKEEDDEDDDAMEEDKEPMEKATAEMEEDEDVEMKDSEDDDNDDEPRRMRTKNLDEDDDDDDDDEEEEEEEEEDGDEDGEDDAEEEVGSKDAAAKEDDGKDAGEDQKAESKTNKESETSSDEVSDDKEEEGDAGMKDVEDSEEQEDKEDSNDKKKEDEKAEASESKKEDDEGSKTEASPSRADQGERKRGAVEPKKEESTKNMGAVEPKKNKAATPKEEKASEVVPKIVRPMSLAAIPSFYQQDMRRIRVLHTDLMAASMQEHARKRLTEVTEEYNKVFRASNEVFDRRARVQTQLNSFVFENRNKVNKFKNDYNVQVAMARGRWMKQKMEYDVERISRIMPSKWGRQPIGTNVTKHYLSKRGDPISATVGIAVGDIVDTIIMKMQGNISDKKFDDFVAPPPPDIANMVVDQQRGETFAQQQHRIDTKFRNDITALSMKLHESEEERKRAWKKIMKTKAEFDLPHITHDGGGNKRRINLDLTNYQLIPPPALRSSTLQTIPAELPNRSILPSFSGDGDVDSKYSAARVRERIGADGSVAPVSEPKKTKDGLYQRPAGRTRKGMEWDAVRGIWVPQRKH